MRSRDWLVATLACSVGVAVQAGVGATQGRLLHDRCSAPAACTVDVGITGAGPDQCGIVMKHVVIVDTSIDQVVWNLKAGGSVNLANYAFGLAAGNAAGGVVVEDNNDDPALDGSSTPPLRTVFSVTASEATKMTVAVDPVGRKRRKAFLYTVNVMRKDGDTWRACTPHDPLIVTRGD